MFRHHLFISLLLFSYACQSAWCDVRQRTIQSSFGTYLRAYKTSFSVDLSSGQPWSWEHWYIENYQGRLTLRAIHSPARYLRANRDGTVDLNNHTIEWELWHQTANADGSLSYQSVHGSWLSAAEDGSVRTARTRGVTEHFWLDPWTAQNPIINANWTEDVKGKRYVMSLHGTYLTAVPEARGDEELKRQGKVNMAGAPAGWWQQWHIDKYDDKVALRAADLFLSADREGEVYLSDRIIASSLWTPYYLENGARAFRGARNRWLGANKEGKVRTVVYRGEGAEFWLEPWE